MKNKIPSLIPFSREWLLSWLGIVVGALLLSVGYVLFINPYKIVPGGVYGIGIILNSFFPDVQVGSFGLMMDIPLLIISFFVFGAKSGARTIVAALLTPIFMNVLTNYIGNVPELMLSGRIDLSNDMLLTSLFGGVVSGVGLGLIFRSNATSGGTDIVSMVISKYSRLSLPTAMIIVESTIVIVGVIIFNDWKLPLYSIITIFTSVQIIDYILDGPTNDKMLFVISDKHLEIKSFVMDHLSRGGTYIRSSGMYTGKEHKMMFIVVRRREINLVKSYITDIDPEVFMVVVNAHETVGDGFKNYKKL